MYSSPNIIRVFNQHGGTKSVPGGENITNLSENPKQTLGGLGINGRTILQWIPRKEDVRVSQDGSG
jgi:hypothetical protein